ncbi:UNVERIFIED_CONTAM: hypothetical protein K2H54_045632 [Gekko kuhli]
MIAFLLHSSMGSSLIPLRSYKLPPVLLAAFTTLFFDDEIYLVFLSGPNNYISGFKCPVCSKFVSSDEMDLHLVMCLTKPRITYNDILKDDTT